MVPLIDTHQHLIYRNDLGYGWTNSIPPLAKGDFTLEDYRQLTAGLGISGTLFMETGVNDDDYQKETRLIHQLATGKNSGVTGLISSIRPESNEGFDSWLEECLALGVAGFRRILHVVEDEMSQSNAFRANIKKIGDADRPFDICFLSRQLPIAIELATACDNTKLVLNHCGVPDIAADGLDPWRERISTLAGLPNVYCKLSGIMAYCKPGESSLEAIQPYVDHILESFGPQRIVWGSDWPVVNLAKGLPEWLSVTRTILNTLSPDEAKSIANANAREIYQIP